VTRTDSETRSRSPRAALYNRTSFSTYLQLKVKIAAGIIRSMQCLYLSGKLYFDTLYQNCELNSALNSHFIRLATGFGPTLI